MKPYYEDSAVQIFHGDCRDILRELSGIDMVVTDPPYELGFIGKAWDKQGISFQPETWRIIKDACKPGTMMLSFGGTRTWHRIAVAIEDAGWEIRDTLMWLYGQGFPKSLDISKAIDATGKRYEFFDEVREFLSKALKVSGYTIREINEAMGLATNGSGMAGHWFANITQQTLPTKAQWFKLKELLGFNGDFDETFRNCVNPNERPIIGKDTNILSWYSWARAVGNRSALPALGAKTEYRTWDITAPATPEAQSWSGYGTALKPAFEPIILAMKPLDGTFAENALKHGVAGLNIDGSRIPFQSKDDLKENQRAEKGGTHFNGSKHINNFGQPRSEGRFPANLLLDEEAAQMLDEQSGVRTGTGMCKQKSGNGCWPYGSTEVSGYTDSGGASRFFYCAKSSKSERNKGCEELYFLKENTPQEVIKEIKKILAIS